MLLMLVKGAKCYADVRTYNGTVYGSFKDACTARGLLGDDTEWYYAFDEALKWDIQHRIRCSLHDASYTVPVDELRNMLLDELAVVFAKNYGSILDHALPLKTVYANDSIVNNMVSDELSQDCETLIKTAETMQQQLNEDQKVAFKSIVDKRLAVQTADAVVQAEAAAFAEWVLSIGDGTIPAVARQGESGPTWITIPDEHLVHTEVDKITAIVESVYVDFFTRYSDPNYLKERAILTPTNDIAEDVNKHVLSMVSGEEREYLSCDSTGNAADGICNIDIFYPVEMAVNLLSEIHSGSNQWTISVLVSRMWHYRGGTDEGPLQHTDVVLIDQEGNHMYDQLPPATSERLKDVLEEGKVFVIRKFMCTESRPSFRPVESPFMVQFTRYTTLQEMPGLADTYPFCTYSQTSFADIPAPAIRPARFVDVIGKIEMVSDIVPVQSIYQTAASNTRTIILKELLGNELRLVLWGERALEFDAEAVHAMGVKELVIAIFVETLPKMSHGPGAIVPHVFEAPIEKTTQELNDADPFIDMVAAGAIGKQLLPLMRQRYPGYTTVGELAQAAKRDTAIPSEIERLIGQKYKLLVSISKRWNSGNSENLRYQECQLHQIRWVGQETEAIVSDPLCLRTSPVYKVLVCMALASCLVPVVSSAAMNHMKSLSVS
ncbi:hypothetical protein ACQ4PT_026719 [Festuca glaucescens]